MERRDEGEGKVGGIEDVVDMIVLVRRGEDSVTNGVDRRVRDGNPNVVVKEVMAAITEHGRWRV